MAALCQPMPLPCVSIGWFIRHSLRCHLGRGVSYFSHSRISLGYTALQPLTHFSNRVFGPIVLIDSTHCANLTRHNYYPWLWRFISRVVALYTYFTVDTNTHSSVGVDVHFATIRTTNARCKDGIAVIRETASAKAYSTKLIQLCPWRMSQSVKYKCIV